MTARVLIVDDVPANLKLLDAKLTAEYFDVLKASSGPEALEIAKEQQPDIILLDVMMPGMDGFEVCRRLKDMPETEHIPVVMVTALDQPKDRVQGLESGADDFLTKPLNDLALFARVRSLVRLKMVTDELRMREATGQRIGALSAKGGDNFLMSEPGRILAIDDRPTSLKRITETLAGEHMVTVAETQDELMQLAQSGNFDLHIVSLTLQEYDGLRLCSQLRSLEATRQTPILVIVEDGDTGRLVRALDMGVNDYLVRPVERNELVARARSQLRRKRYQDYLRDKFQQGLELAITDGLTGLHNRRYMEGHLATLVTDAANTGKPVSLLIFDIDHFKPVNDTYGHAAGDAVLKQFADRIANNVRGVDLACRLGGEEFVVVMPDTDIEYATSVAERLRQCIAAKPFLLDDGGRELDVTVSIGIAVTSGPNDTVAKLMERADQGLYRAKRDGRNRVAAEAA
ncbi:PleD family two-component system response regulator [Parvibaculum sp.]|uniref:PleD family two-component system response regulator n=1 Tax=Parvibaculum sp. TaxID=2024848 RepID=UPI001B248972|nr:PleD family two-component system response regulator [Parvibaculum sp.]MBO6634399.1 PleD family two-component system response regulator [Parvibaculum sp.]MBO6680152.1 PleD family two-component system response regulator [Parvibaculum sp.]MBO6683857.1 PleD family two-component system response regulator [Parvibaculum sp.]MBO6904130.1 PleD family two-component system response regulator [Parvibaculum sp.]